MRAQQVTALLLCTLLSSTLAHDYLRAKYLSPKEGSSKLISPFEERAGPSSGETCTWVCHHNTSTTGSLQVFINSTTNIIAIYNSTAKVGLIIDINTRIIGLFNGTSGDAILINITSQTGLYIKGTETSATWHSSNECFKTFFYRLTTLKIFFELNVGTAFSIKTISHELLVIIAELVIVLTNNLSVKIRQNLRYALELLINISTTVITLLSGSLKGLLTFAVEGVIIHLAGDLVWFVGVLEGLSVVFGAISGGLAALIKAKVAFDLAVIFAAVNGIELFINILLAIVARVNLSQLGSLLGSLDKLFEVIVKLGGSVHYGVTGLLNVVWHLILLINGKIEVAVFIEVLVKFAAYRTGNKEEIDIDIYIEGLLQVVSIQNSTYGSSKSIKALYANLILLQKGTLVINGINISQIIKLLRGTVSNALELVARILLSIGGIVTFAKSITTLLLYLVQLLLTVDGVVLLKLLIPGLVISIKVGSNGNLLEAILKSINLTIIVRLLLGGVWGILTYLPIVKDIVTALSAAIKSSCGSHYSLQTLVSSSGVSFTKFIALLKTLLYGTSTSSSSSVGINSTATASATASTKSGWSWTWKVIG